MSRQTHSLNAYEVGLTSGISDVDTSFPVESTVGLTAPGYLVLDPDDPTKREYFRFESINGSNLEMPNTGFRGLKGSAAGAQAHLAGARVRAVAVGQWLDDIFADINDLEAAQAAFLFLDGSRAMTGDLNMGDNKIEVLATPVLDDDATTKLYVDTLSDILVAEDLTFLKLDGTRPMTGPLRIDSDTNQLTLGDTDASTYERSILFHDDDNFNISIGTTADFRTLLTLDRVNNQAIIAAQIRGLDGSAGAPAYTFLNSVVDGMYYVGANTIGFTSAGNRRLSLNPDQLIIGNASTTGSPLMHTFPSQTEPAFTFFGNINTGMYRLLANQIGFAAAGNLRMAISDTKVTVGNEINTGTAMMHITPTVNAIGYAFFGDPNTGMHRTANNQVALLAGGSVRFEVRLNDIRSQGVWDSTTTGGANVNIVGPTSYLLRQSTSSLKVKDEVELITDGVEIVKRSRPIRFRSNLPNDDGRLQAGFGAEWIEEDFPEAQEDQNYDVRAMAAANTSALKAIIEHLDL